MNGKRPLARVVALGDAHLYGFVDERELSRIPTDAAAIFYPDDPGQAEIAAHVVTLDDVNSRVLDVPYLAAVHGGDIEVTKNKQGELVATRGIYRVTLAPQPARPAPAMVQRGIVHIQGTPESLVMRAWNRTWGVVLRESGF